MVRARFLTDEHVPKAVAKGLRGRGIDAVTAAEAGTLGVEDPGLLDHMKAEGRVVITHDWSFCSADRQQGLLSHVRLAEFLRRTGTARSR